MQFFPVVANSSNNKKSSLLIDLLKILTSALLDVYFLYIYCLNMFFSLLVKVKKKGSNQT